MFYSHEILTNRKYGVATIWLVATLGSREKSTVSLKKVTKKAINGVDIRKACETIMEPEAPMALRLQSNLLYGVHKVYNEQWRYLLSDAQAAQQNIRSMLRSARSDGLDPNAGKANRDQLMMMDDPAFSPDMPLPDFGFDLDRALTSQGDTQRSSQSMLSIRGRSGSVSSHAASVISLNISSSSNDGAYQLPQNDPFRSSSAQKPAKPNMFEEEEPAFQDDDIFEFDADGQIRDIPASEREARRAGSLVPQYRLGSDSAASGRVRKDHEDAQGGLILPIYDAQGDFDMNQYGDDDMALPDAEAFPVMTGALDGNDQAFQGVDVDHVHSSPRNDPFPDSAEAPQARKKVKKPRFLKVDSNLVIRNMATLDREYVDNQAAQTLINNNKKAVQHAKPNAFRFVYGSGLNSTGQLGKLASPLDMFSGEALIAKLGGKSLTKVKRGPTKKRAHEDASDDEASPPKRARDDEIGRGADGQDDEAFNMPDEDPFVANDDTDVSFEIERGRDAPSALPDYPSSAMPWNVSASLHSHQRGHSSSVQGGRLGSQGPAGRRLTSASPLIGRGSALPGALDEFNDDDMMGMDDDGKDAMVMYGRSSRSSSQIPGLGFGAMGIKSSSQAGAGDDEFEMFGAAAGVDTQTAGESQWLRSVLDTESNNFLDYVKNTIAEKTVNELSEGGGEGEGGEGGEGAAKSVTFEDLFEPEKNTCMVAAQAFYHVLSLATKGRVWVDQEVEDMQPWGEIKIGVLSV